MYNGCNHEDEDRLLEMKYDARIIRYPHFDFVEVEGCSKKAIRV